MIPPHLGATATPSRATHGPTLRVALFLTAFLLVASPLAVALLVPAAHPAAGAPMAVNHPDAPASAPAPLANATSFNPPCYKIDTTVCVSILNRTETDIIPPTGSFVSTQEPNASSDITLVVKSHRELVWNGAPKSGPNVPVCLNVTGVLWNGDPYYSIYDGTIWHANSQTIWYNELPYVSSNLSYPYWYTVALFAHGTGGAPNFFPGMTVNWWIYLTYNVSANASNPYTHHVSPAFRFTYSGSWPFSPYPGSGQYAGASATFENINVTVTPRYPNFNDSVTVQVNTTQADVLSNATIGVNSYLDLTEQSPNGSLLGVATLPFPVSLAGGFGAVSTSVKIPAVYSQLPGATVTYVLSIRDVANDLLVTPPSSYVVGGNGSFLSGIFTDDLELLTGPSSIAAAPVGVVQLAPGSGVNLTLLSRNPGTAISAAEAVYVLSYPLLHETLTLTVPLTRVTSTQFVGAIPGLPIGSFVNFTIYAWDFSQRLEISPEFGYFTPDFATQVPSVPGNASFFYVFVYDNGSHTWVSGAKVQIQGYGGVFNSQTNTTAGVAYPNQTFQPFTPLLLAANFSYQVTVTDPYFVPDGGVAAPPVTATILVVHAMGARQTLLTGPDYSVVQEGNTVVFWLNATPPPPAISPSTGASVPLPALVGIGAGVLLMFPLLLWWRQIRARRKAEERRVTL